MPHFSDDMVQVINYMLIFVFMLAGMLMWEEYVKRRAKRLAPKVLEFGLSNFELLDHDKDGSISDNDLHWARWNAALETEKRALVKHMLHELEEARIGHQVRMGTKVLRGPYGSFVPFPNPIHEISRWDLKNYVEQLAEKGY